MITIESALLLMISFATLVVLILSFNHDKRK